MATFCSCGCGVQPSGSVPEAGGGQDESDSGAGSSSGSSGNSGSGGGSGSTSSGGGSDASSGGNSDDASSGGNPDDASSDGSARDGSGSGGMPDSGGTVVAGPCDIYATGGAPCVAAHSTVRALYGAYSGNLYQVRRASDKTTKDIGVLASGGFADSAAQDAFCTGTTCTISIIYDQSPKGNHLEARPRVGPSRHPTTKPTRRLSS